MTVRYICTLALILFASLAVYSQKSENFKLVAERTDGAQFYVNKEEVKLVEGGIEFYSLLVIDPKNGVLFTVRGSCVDQTVAILAVRGLMDGEKFEHKFDNPETVKAKEPFTLALKEVCGEQI